jgi:PAS domain S-box-containing protein
MKFFTPFRHGPVTDRIYRQLTIMFLFALLLVVFGFALSIHGLSQINSHTQQVIEVNNKKLQLARIMLEALQSRRYSLFIYAHLDDEFAHQDSWETFNQAASDYLTARAQMLELDLSVEEQQELRKLDRLTAAAQPMQLAVIHMIQQGELENARKYLIEEARIAQEHVIRQITKIVDIQKGNNLTAKVASDEIFLRTILEIVLIVFLIIISGIVLAYGISGSIAIKSGEIEHQQRKFKALFEASHDAVVLINGWYITEYNEAAEKLFLINAVKQDQLNLKSLLPERQENGDDTAALIFDAVGQAIRRHEYVSLAAVLNRMDGERFAGEIHISVIELDGQRIVQMVVREVPEHKQVHSRVA